MAQEPCPTTTGTYDADGLFALGVMGVIGEERLFLKPTWTMSGFKDEGGLAGESGLALRPSGPGTHSVRVTYGALSAEYQVVLQ